MESKKCRCRDSEATRSAALDAAQRLFAAKGFAGASMREIAAASGVSQPLIHYHFGSKEGLYSAVKERLMREGVRSILPAGDDSSPGAPGPLELIRAAYRFISGNEDLTRLIAWSHLEKKQTPWPGEEELTKGFAAQIERFLSVIPRKKDVDPLIASLMVGALILFWSQNSEYYSSYFDAPLVEVTERYLGQIARFFSPDGCCRGDDGA